MKRQHPVKRNARNRKPLSIKLYPMISISNPAVLKKIIPIIKEIIPKISATDSFSLRIFMDPSANTMREHAINPGISPGPIYSWALIYNIVAKTISNVNPNIHTGCFVNNLDNWAVAGSELITFFSRICPSPVLIPAINVSVTPIQNVLISNHICILPQGGIKAFLEIFVKTNIINAQEIAPPSKEN
jgi:hypothetical protein